VAWRWKGDGMRDFWLCAALILGLAGSTLGGPEEAGAPVIAPLQGAAVSWWVYAPDRAAFDAATLVLDPALPGAPALSSACTGRMQADGTAFGQCHIADGRGNAWDETFRCDQPAGRAPLVLPGAAPAAGCLGEVEISGGSGRFAGLTGSGLFALYAMAVTPDGRIIGYALRRYDGGS
jgi:hypothetical protein